MIVLSLSAATSAARIAAAPAMPFFAQKAVTMMASSPAAAATSVLSSASASVMPAALALRGGVKIQQAFDGFDLGRTRIRLDGLHSYAVVTVLLMNAALRLYSSTPKKMADDAKVDNFARVLFVTAVGLSVMSGAYTTIVMALLEIYSKTALGMGNDQAFVEFFARTAGVRKLAFDCFISALVSFNASFVLSLFLKLEGKLRWYAAGTALALGIISIMSWSSIIHIAGGLLFK